MADPELIGGSPLDWLRGLPSALSESERAVLCLRCRQPRGRHSIGAERCPHRGGYSADSAFLARTPWVVG